MHVAEKHEKKLGLVEGLTTIVDQEGYAGLYKGELSYIKSYFLMTSILILYLLIGIGPKLVQSVITAAFLFAFKDAFYAMTIKARARAKAIKA